MKLTKKAREELRTALRHMERAQAFIDAPSTHICVESRMSSADVLSREPYDSLRVMPITKECGSHIVGLRTAIDYLADFLVRH